MSAADRKAKGPQVGCERVYVDKDGYDKHSTYWGPGQAVYRFPDCWCGGVVHIRAKHASVAKAIFCSTYSPLAGAPGVYVHKRGKS